MNEPRGDAIRAKFLVIIPMISVFAMFVMPESFQEESDSQNMGQIKWLEFNINSKIPAFKIQVSDNDMNKNPELVDKFKIRVWSNADPIGIMVSVYETEKNSGLFVSPVYFSEDMSAGQRLRVYDGDTATASYVDRTLPTSHASDKIEVSDTITIYHPTTNPLENKSQFIRIEDETFSRQSLQTGETISESGTFTAILIGSMGPLLIVFFIALYAVKKIRTKKGIKTRK